MSDRASHLHATVEQQITELTLLVRNLDPDQARLPCPGREKLGDGTIGAIVQHTASNYVRIAAFVQTSDQMTSRQGQQPGHRTPGFLRKIRHDPRPTGHDRRDANRHAHDTAGNSHHAMTAATLDTSTILEQLAHALVTLATLGELTDSQLNTTPPDGTFRFCDGTRTLEQVLESLLQHQAHQLQALTAAAS
jgi:hypothetical protein